MMLLELLGALLLGLVGGSIFGAGYALIYEWTERF